MKPLPVAIILTLLFSAGCGLNSGPVVLNEGVPSGAMLIYQGSFPGSGVSGTAQVYSSSGQAVLRFAGLQTPTDTRYYFFLETGGGIVYSGQLKGPVGSQNYFTGLAVGPTWSRVSFRETSNTADPEISQAALTFVPP